MRKRAHPRRYQALLQFRRLQFAQVPCDVVVEEVHLSRQTVVLLGRLRVAIRFAKNTTPDAGWTLGLQGSEEKQRGFQFFSTLS